MFKMRYLLLILHVICLFMRVYSDCDKTVSVTDFGPLDCDKSQDLYYKESIEDSCIPGCYYGLAQGDFPCYSKDDCAPGLSCNEYDECEVDPTSCYSSHHEAPPPKWVPDCLSDGTFAPKQCKGEPQNGRCFCYDRFGKRIFGEAWSYDQQNMTCACSRHRSELMLEGRADVTLHCDSMGNYESLQCDSGSCWCADPRTGEVIESVVPESMMTILPCYDKTEVGGKYLRQCESQLVAQAIIRKEFSTHGTTFVSLPYVFCDWDGSYGRYKVISGQLYCTWRDNTNLGSWSTDLSDLKNTNCNCARDTKTFELAGRKQTQECIRNGNYKALQQYDDINSYCVDIDGYMTTNILPNLHEVSCPKK